jgi:hypothetical protein
MEPELVLYSPTYDYVMMEHGTREQFHSTRLQGDGLVLDDSCFRSILRKFARIGQHRKKGLALLCFLSSKNNKLIVFRLNSTNFLSVRVS